MKMPIGYRTSDTTLRLAINFEEALFAKIKVMAAKENKSFSTMVNELCKVGIFDLEESDKLEPVE